MPKTLEFDLLEGRLDLVLIPRPFGNSRLTTEVIFHEPLQLITPENHQLAKLKKSKPSICMAEYTYAGRTIQQLPPNGVSVCRIGRQYCQGLRGHQPGRLASNGDDGDGINLSTRALHLF